MTTASNCISLELESNIGISGEILDSVVYSNCGSFIVYVLGNSIVVRDLMSSKSTFLTGHTNRISCLTISPDGTKLASGEITRSGVQAHILQWDLDRAIENCLNGINRSEECLIRRLEQHVGGIKSLDYSYDSQFILSLGVEEDNSLVIWDAETGRAVCGMPAHVEVASSAKWKKTRNDQFVTCGKFHFRVWQVDYSVPKMHAMDVKMGKLRRMLQCLAIAPDDSFAAAGTDTGDVLKFTIEREGLLRPNDPDAVTPMLVGVSNDRYSQGVSTLFWDTNPVTGNLNILVGAGDGTVGYVNGHMVRVTQMEASLSGGVTSISPSPDDSGFMVTTTEGNRYFVNRDLEPELRSTAHHTPVTSACFPQGCSDLLLTSGFGNIRIWNIRNNREVLRVQVPNANCNQVIISNSGSLLLSAWSDERIRAFLPESGRLKFTIHDAHPNGVRCIDMNANDQSSTPWRLVSGGEDGSVRVWQMTSSSQSLVHTMKEHRGPINAIKVNRNATQFVSASADGSCIVWDMERCVRILGIFEPTVFEDLVYHPDESQMLTCELGCKISYWDAYDGSAIRIIDGGDKAMLCCDIDKSEGEFFVTGSEDSLLKVWAYDEGITVGLGEGHSGRITSVKISPDQRRIVTVGEFGEIFTWKMPSFRSMREVLDEEDV
jgi:WD40 repeat protein